MSLALRQFPSYINQELNLEPPAAMDHAEDDASDDDDDDDNGRYELWTFRIPVGMNLSDLHGVELPPETIAGKPTLSATKSGKKLTIEPGETAENVTFRLLVPSNAKDGRSSSDDDDDSDNDNTNDTNTNYLLHPSSKKFRRHFNVFENLPPKPSEAELAPAEGPAPTGCVLKRAYSHIPQRTNLKRRWMPPGNRQKEALEIPQGLITMKSHGTADAKRSSRKNNNNDDDDDDDDDDDSQGAAVEVVDTKPSATKHKKSKPSSAKRRRTTDDKAKTDASPVVSPPKKKRTKTEKKASKKNKKQAKKDKKRRHSTASSSKREDDAISV